MPHDNISDANESPKNIEKKTRCENDLKMTFLFLSISDRKHGPAAPQIKTLEEKRDSRGLTLIKADNFLRYVLLHSTSGDPNIMVRRIMRTSSSDSEVVTGLEIWRQMAVTYAGSAQTRVVTLLKQIMTPSEWNPEKSSNVLQMYHHWLELISKYESLSSEKIASSIKITLALQNVHGPLANALSLSITEKSTWNDIHNLLINYFNNSIPSDTKEIYQFDISGKVSKEDSVNQVGKKGKGKSKKSKGQSKGKGPLRISIKKARGSQRDNQKERLNQKEKVNGPHGQVNRGHGIRIKVKVGKVKEKDIKYVLTVVVKVTQLINAGGLRKLVLQELVQIIKGRCAISQLSLGIILSQSCPQISSEDFKISDLFINNSLTINHTFHSHLHHQRCPQSLPLSKVKDSVVISFESTTSHQVSQKTSSWRSASPIPSMTLVHHCLKNVKNLGQLSLTQEQLHQLLLNHFVPHLPIKEKSETLTSVNGGNIKVLGIKHVTFITGKVIIHVNFLIVEDVKNPIIGLDAIHHSHLQVHLHGKGKCILQQHHHKALLHYHQSHYYASGLVLPDHVQSHHLRWSDPQFPTLDKQSASNIIAEIDDKIISDSRKIILEEESQEDLSQQAQVPHCLKTPFLPRPVQLKENFMNSLIYHSGHGAKFVIEQKDFKVSTNISLKRSQV